ncbi:hypothetical protein FHS96_004956 [Sphingomonas zeicaulis]|uniref:hypothetical protein n=1 Tax=Sphingomonas zeicaulis TaxID=1632740 RepID=UPI003D19A298
MPAPDDTELRRLALLAAKQAMKACATLTAIAAEGPDHPEPFGHEEVIELLCDAAKIALAMVDTSTDDERGQIEAALARYLEGWVG